MKIREIKLEKSNSYNLFDKAMPHDTKPLKSNTTELNFHEMFQNELNKLGGRENG